jgi:hypothetical protein
VAESILAAISLAFNSFEENIVHKSGKPVEKMDKGGFFSGTLSVQDLDLLHKT